MKTFEIRLFAPEGGYFYRFLGVPEQLPDGRGNYSTDDRGRTEISFFTAQGKHVVSNLSYLIMEEPTGWDEPEQASPEGQQP